MSEAGKLSDRVILAKRAAADPGAPDYGNPDAGEWIDQGTIWAQLIYLRGGEAVIAGRLTGHAPVVVRVRSWALTQQVTTEWRITDAERGTIFAVRSVNPDPEGDRAWIDLLCETGVAA